MCIAMFYLDCYDFFFMRDCKFSLSNLAIHRVVSLSDWFSSLILLMIRKLDSNMHIKGFFQGRTHPENGCQFSKKNILSVKDPTFCILENFQSSG